MSAWLEALLGKIFNSGVSLPLSKGLNFTDGLAAALNPSTKQIDVSLSLTDGQIAPGHLAAESGGFGVVFVLRIALTAGTPGTADDVAGPAAPFDLRILDRWADIETAIGGSTLRVRDDVGGGGDALSGVLSSASTTDSVRANSSTGAEQSTLDEGEIPYVRRSDRGVAGTVYLLCERA